MKPAGITAAPPMADMEQEKSSSLTCPACGASLKVEAEAPEPSETETPSPMPMPSGPMGGGAKSSIADYLSK
jgi:hypothetical protein